MSNIEFDFRTLPRDYGDVRAEARSCRSAAALFDFSFMRRIWIRGHRSNALVQTLTPRRIDDLLPGRIRYALCVGVDGRVLGDITIWRLDGETFEVFAAGGDAFARLQAAAGSMASVCDLSGETAIFAVQGPSSLRALAGVASTTQLRALPYFGHLQENIAGVACRVGRLGYTGERGFEIIFRATRATPSGRCWHDMRGPRALPPPTFCGLKRAFPCSPTSSCFRCRQPNSGSGASQPSRMRQAARRVRNAHIRSALRRFRRGMMASRSFGARRETPPSRRHRAACWRRPHAQASSRARCSDWATLAMRMVRRTCLTRAANSGTFTRFPCRSTIRTSAGRAVDGAMIFRPMIFRPTSPARIIHSTDDVIAVLSLTR